VVADLVQKDMIMFFTMALSAAGWGVILASCASGAGKHLGDLTPEQRIKGLKLNFMSQPIYMICICTTKLSVGASLLRIATTRFWRTTIIATMACAALYTTVFFITLFCQCTDLRVLWDAAIPATCWGQHTLQSLSYTSNALNITTDLLLALVIPAPMLWNLNVNTRTRLTLIGILGLGVFACSAALVKLGFIVNYGKVGDFLWDSQDITIWTVAEVNIAIVAGSLPALRPLFKTILGSTYGRGSRKTPMSGSHPQSRSRQSRVGKHWRSLPSSHKRDDDTSSQTGFNSSEFESSHELDRVSGSPEGTIKTTCLSATDFQRNKDDLESPVAMDNRIRATTVTRVEIGVKEM
jgi:hypothetical protein